MYVCVYVCIHTCMYICMYVCYFPYSNTMSCNVCIVLFHSVNTNFDKRKLFKMNTYIRTHNHTLQTLYVLFAVILLTKWSVCLSVSDPFADTPLRRTPSHHTIIHSYTHTLIHSYTHTLIHLYTYTHSYTHFECFGNKLGDLWSTR